jgi:hypothetical protein
MLTMKLNGMVEALEEQRKTAEMASWSFEDRLALLVERQVAVEGRPNALDPPEVRQAPAAGLQRVILSVS